MRRLTQRFRGSASLVETMAEGLNPSTYPTKRPGFHEGSRAGVLLEDLRSRGCCDSDHSWRASINVRARSDTALPVAADDSPPTVLDSTTSFLATTLRLHQDHLLSIPDLPFRWLSRSNVPGLQVTPSCVRLGTTSVFLQMLRQRQDQFRRGSQKFSFDDFSPELNWRAPAPAAPDTS